MKNRTSLFAALLLLVPFFYLAAIWPLLPKVVPVHFNFSGRADRFGNKTELAIMTAALGTVSLVVYLLLTNVHRLTKYAPEANKGRMQKIALAVLLFMTLVQCWILNIIQSGSFSFKFILIAVCLLLATLGNYMPNLKPNYVAGFRLPWTLHNADNWRKTHFIAGRVMFAGGFIGAFVCLVAPFKTALVVSAILFFIMFLLPAIYSYRLAERAKH